MQCGGKANYGKENLCDDSAVPYQLLTMVQYAITYIKP